MDQARVQQRIRIAGRAFEGPYTNPAKLRHAAGIYVVLDRRSDGKWSCVDVGESVDVRLRVENHDRASCWRRHRRGVLGVAALYTPGWTADQRRRLEWRIRQAYAPACGDR